MLYTFAEVEAMGGPKYKTLAKRHERGTLAAVFTEGKWRITDEVLHGLIPGSLSSGTYASLVGKWLADMKSGYHTGKPLTPKFIRQMDRYLKRYWALLGIRPELEALTPDNLKKVYAAIPIEGKKCHYGVKADIYKAVCSFSKLLSREGLKPKSFNLEMKTAKPKRVFPARKTVLKKNELEQLLKANENYTRRRTTFDIALSRAIIILGAYAGLRRSEIAALKLKDVDLHNKVIHVIDGKNHKDGTIGICPTLHRELKVWLKDWRVGRGISFLTQVDGAPVNSDVIDGRMKTLSNHSGLDFTTHGLRRTCATLLAADGCPPDFIRIVLRHEDLKTTQGYLMTEESAAADWVKNWQP